MGGRIRRTGEHHFALLPHSAQIVPKLTHASNQRLLSQRRGFLKRQFRALVLPCSPDSIAGDLEVLRLLLDADELAPCSNAGDSGCTRSHKRVDDRSQRLNKNANVLLHQWDWLAGWMVPIGAKR